MNESNSLVIETRDLSKTYKQVNALNSLNLHVHKNSIFGFLGPNGAGKTTTIKLLLGLAKPSGAAAPFSARISCATASRSAGASAIWPKSRAITNI